ncbi:hypothetical protein AB1N83_012866, partial [Pleurotus pulmonarius]
MLATEIKSWPASSGDFPGSSPDISLGSNVRTWGEDCCHYIDSYFRKSMIPKINHLDTMPLISPSQILQKSQSLNNNLNFALACYESPCPTSPSGA